MAKAKKPAAKAPTKKATKTEALLARIQKKQKDTSAALLSGGAMSNVRHVIPTGIDVVDHHVIGIGGLPCGRITEVFGFEGCGKSSMVFQAIAQAQRLDYPVVFIETEQALETGRLLDFGVDLENVILNQPRHIEEVMEFLEDTLASIEDDQPTFIAWDSIAETPSEREVKGGVAKEDKPGERAKSLSKLIRVMKRETARKQAACVFVNQLRDKIGVKFGEPTTTPGGHALKFASSLRLQFKGGTAHKKGEEHIGLKPLIEAKKNKHCPPRRQARIRLDFNDGWNNQWTTINYAKDLSLIPDGARVSAKNYAIAMKALGW